MLFPCLNKWVPMIGCWWNVSPDNQFPQHLCPIAVYPSLTRVTSSQLALAQPVFPYTHQMFYWSLHSLIDPYISKCNRISRTFLCEPHMLTVNRITIKFKLKEDHILATITNNIDLDAPGKSHIFSIGFSRKITFCKLWEIMAIGSTSTSIINFLSAIILPGAMIDG